MAYEDRTLPCQECGQSFVFSAEDQTYHAEKGYTNDPKRCPTCREARRGQRFSRGDSGGSSSGGSSGGSGYGRPRQMFPATCAQCGKQTEVPFEPRGTRPVYCSDCYSKQRASSPSSRRY